MPFFELPFSIDVADEKGKIHHSVEGSKVVEAKTLTEAYSILAALLSELANQFDCDSELRYEDELPGSQLLQ